MSAPRLPTETLAHRGNPFQERGSRSVLELGFHRSRTAVVEPGNREKEGDSSEKKGGKRSSGEHSSHFWGFLWFGCHVIVVAVVCLIYPLHKLGFS